MEIVNGFLDKGGVTGSSMLRKVLEVVLKEKLVTGISKKEKIVDFKHPHELQKLLDLEIREYGCDEDAIAAILDSVVKYSVKTGHPRFFNQLYGGIDCAALSGAWLTEALNTNQYTFEVAPVFVIIEKYVIEKIIQIFHWEDGDGIFAPGGSIANMYGIVLAKHRMFPELKQKGLFGAMPLVAFTSDQGHYSVKKAAIWLGLGLEQVVPIKTNEYGSMMPSELAAAITRVKEEGRQPFFVNATAGTTVLGGFDPFNEIHEICKAENLWLHIDACWGGACMLSKKHQHLMNGCEKADSISWNPHKMMGAPLQCSSFIVKYKGLLKEANGLMATYLFQQDKFYDVSYDVGDKSVQCGRKVDAFKLWMLLKVNGMSEIKNRVDTAFESARYLESKVTARDGFRPVQTGLHCTNVCFWYIPPSFRDLPEDETWWQELGKIAPRIKERMVQEGTLMIGYQPLTSKNFVNFFRVVMTCYPKCRQEDMDFVLDEIERLGQDL